MKTIQDYGKEQHTCASCGRLLDKLCFYGKDNESRESGEWICDECWSQE